MVNVVVSGMGAGGDVQQARRRLRLLSGARTDGSASTRVYPPIFLQAWHANTPTRAPLSTTLIIHRVSAGAASYRAGESRLMLYSSESGEHLTTPVPSSRSKLQSQRRHHGRQWSTMIPLDKCELGRDLTRRKAWFQVHRVLSS